MNVRRTVYQFANNIQKSGEDCSACGTDYDECTVGVLRRSEPCCSRCGHTDTHREQVLPFGDERGPREQLWALQRQVHLLTQRLDALVDDQPARLAQVDALTKRVDQLVAQLAPPQRDAPGTHQATVLYFLRKHSDLGFTILSIRDNVPDLTDVGSSDILSALEALIARGLVRRSTAHGLIYRAVA